MCIVQCPSSCKKLDEKIQTHTCNMAKNLDIYLKLYCYLSVKVNNRCYIEIFVLLISTGAVINVEVLSDHNETQVAIWKRIDLRCM